jgi:hypothetical protein
MKASEENLSCVSKFGSSDFAILDRFSIAITVFEKNSFSSEFKNQNQCGT